MGTVCFVLVMFGSRFVTLRFGQVFPDVSAAQQRRIEALESRVQQMASGQSQTQEHLAALEQAVVQMQADNQKLTQELEKAKHQAPTIVYREAPARSVHHVPSALALPASAPVAPAIKADGVVHRGDGPDKVRAVFGRPMSVAEIGNTECWKYDEYGLKRIVFANSVVSEWNEMPVEP